MLHDLLKDATEHLESMCNQITYAFRIVKAHQKTKWYSLEELLTRSNLTITQVKKKDTAFQTRPSFSFFFSFGRCATVDLYFPVDSDDGIYVLSNEDVEC